MVFVALSFRYWSQYSDQDKAYDASKNFANFQWDIGEVLHSLSGGDPVQLRKYLECLLKSGQFRDPDEMGMLIHALGDAYAHTYVDSIPTLGSPKQLRPNPNYMHERLYPPGFGHFFSGHLPDYIGNNPKKYGDYVDQLYDILSTRPDAGVAHPEWIAELKAGANALPGPGFADYFTGGSLNRGEVNFLKNLDGGYASSAFHFDPDDESRPTLSGRDKSQEPDFRQNLIDKIRNGVKGCCPK